MQQKKCKERIFKNNNFLKILLAWLNKDMRDDLTYERWFKADFWH